jgi:hypothetical protein
VSCLFCQIGEGKIPALDLAANFTELGNAVKTVIGPEVAEYGLEVPTFLVENVSLPEEVEKMLDKRTSMGVIGDMGKFTRFQTAQAIEAAATSPGGGAASEGMGLGMGFAMANQMGQVFGNAQQQQPGQQGGPPQLPPGSGSPPALPQQGAAEWYVAYDGQQAGPLGRDALQQGARAGKLTRDTLVWRRGMAQWVKAAEVQELSDLISEIPPPLPPA